MIESEFDCLVVSLWGSFALPRLAWGEGSPAGSSGEGEREGLSKMLGFMGKVGGANDRK